MASTDLPTETPERGQVFRYEGYDIEPGANLLTCRYSLDGRDFAERVTFDVGDGARWDDPAVDQAARWVFLLAGVSYYKTAAPPVIELPGTPLRTGERAFLRDVYLDGMGEFAYRNGLDLSDLRIDAPVLDGAAAPIPAAADTGGGKRPLVPFGGGIDSIVTVELVRPLADAALFGWQGRTFGVPWWHEKTRLTAPAAAGQRLLQVDTQGLSFGADRPAVMYRGADEFENLDVEEVTPTSILLRNNLTRDWPQGSFVIPVLPAAPQTDIVTTRQLPQYMDSQFRFAAIPGETVVNIPALPAPESYMGHELYTGETNWRGSLTVQYSARRKEVDGVTGPLRIAPKTDFPLVVRGFSWMLRGRAKAQELLAFFGRREGRRFPVWIPSGVEDFKAVADIEAGSSSLRVRPHEHGRLVGRHPARRHVVLILRTGERLPRRILAVEDDTGFSTMTVEPGFDRPVSLSQIKRISYLGLYRLQADSVTFSWATPEVAEVDTQFVLKKEAV